MKGLADSSELTDGYRTGDTARGLLYRGAQFEKPGLLGADGAHLSGEENCIFIHTFVKMMKTLNETFWGKGILIHSTPTCLMPVPAIDAQKPAQV